MLELLFLLPPSEVSEVRLLPPAPVTEVRKYVEPVRYVPIIYQSCGPRG